MSKNKVKLTTSHGEIVIAIKERRVTKIKDSMLTFDQLITVTGEIGPVDTIPVSPASFIETVHELSVVSGLSCYELYAKLIPSIQSIALKRAAHLLMINDKEGKPKYHSKAFNEEYGIYTKLLNLTHKILKRKVELIQLEYQYNSFTRDLIEKSTESNKVK